MATCRTVQFDSFGGPEVIRLAEREYPAPGPGQAVVRHTAIGVNFIDTYHRTGLYPVDLPSGLGLEAAGRVEAVGEGVEAVKEGDRVVYCSGPIGAYADAHAVKADSLVPLPDDVSEADAAACLLKGLTVQYLIRQIHPVAAGETVVFHAAAGGVGLIAMQWLRKLGATVIGTVGSEEKADIAREYGCAHTVLYDREDLVARVREVTNGKGVPVVFDSVGASTFERSLDCLAPRGLMVSFGNASGAVPPFSLGLLAQKGSLMITRPTLATFIPTRERLLVAAGEFMELVRGGTIRIRRQEPLPLAEARRAHELLESRGTKGSLVMAP